MSMKLHKMTLTMVSQVSSSSFTCSHLILTPLRDGFYHHQHSPFTDEEIEAQSEVTCTRSLRSEQPFVGLIRNGSPDCWFYKDSQPSEAGWEVHGEREKPQRSCQVRGEQVERKWSRWADVDT